VFLKSFIAVLVFTGAVHAQDSNRYEVSQRQLDRLLDIIQKLEEKTRQIGSDFGSPDVMPRERDRRDFRRQMSDLQSESSGSLQRWIERVKSKDANPPVTPPTLPAPSDVTLSESFVEATGFSSYYEDAFRQASARALKLCEGWRAHVTSNTAGQIVFGQCSGAEQVKLEDGKMGARVNGSMKLTFAALAGVDAPQSITATFQDSTGFSSHYEDAFQTAVKTTLGQCAKWAAHTKSLSNGILLVQQCGAPKIVKGFDGKAWVSVQGLISYTSRPSKTQPTLLQQSFVNTTNFSSYYADAIKTATAQSEAQCLAWASDTLKNTTALPVVVSCSGPEIMQGNKIDVRFQGKIVLINP